MRRRPMPSTIPTRKLPTVEKLRKMAETDIREVDISTLKDIKDVHIDTSKPVQERIVDYIEQIGNPYCFKSHGVAVKISFAGKRTLEECLCDCLPIGDSLDDLPE